MVSGNYNKQVKSIKEGKSVGGSGFYKTVVRNNGSKNSAKYAKSSVVTAGSDTASAMYTQPIYYSPLHTPQTWQIPVKRREVYMWCRFWYEAEPKIGAAIDIYRDLSMKSIVNVCENQHVKEYFDKFVKDIRLNYWLKRIAHEYYLLGDVFPFLDLVCPKCQGEGITPDGQRCDHIGGSFGSLTVLNPDYIEVDQTVFSADNPTIYMAPDPQLKQTVWNQSPKEEYDRIPKHTRAKILAGQKIMLNPVCVTHLKHAASPYAIYGTSLIKRLFMTLAYKDKMRIAQWVIAERLIVPIKIVKIGNDQRPASEEDLQDVREQLALTQSDPNLTLITHHAFELDWYSASGKILQLGSEFEMCNQDIMDGLMVNKALLNGEGPAYAAAAIGIEAMIARMDSFRESIAEWIEEKIYKPLAYMRGFTEDSDSGSAELIYPTVEFPDLNLRDDTQMKQMYMELKRDGQISSRTLLDYLGIDYDQEVELLRIEASEMAMMPGMDAGMGGMGGGMGMGGLGGLGGMGGGGGPLDMGGAPMDGMDGMGGDMGGGEMGMPGAPGGGGVPGGLPAGPSAEVSGVQPLSMPPQLQWPGAASSLSHLLKHSNKLKDYGPRKMMKGNRLFKIAKDDDDGEEAVYKFTNLELKLYNAIRDYQLPYAFFAQYTVNGQDRLTVDGAFPQLKIAIEADGELFHSSQEQIAKDMERDTILARMGWVVLRFKENDINNSLPKVMQTVFQYIAQRVGASQVPVAM